jgi:uncharacterized protein YjiS (DUF1127 family)
MSRVGQLQPRCSLGRASEFLSAGQAGGLIMFEKGHSVSSFPFKIERQVRIERSLVDGACVRGVMHAFARGLRVLPSLGTPLVRDLATKWVLRRAMRELHRLDDRTLADIGVTRGEIESAVRHGLPTRKLREHNWDGLRPQQRTA